MSSTVMGPALCGVLLASIIAIGIIVAARGRSARAAGAGGRSEDLAAKVASLEARVACLQDRQQIGEAYVKYGRGLDRNDVELLKGAFWPDAEINYGSQSNTIDDFIVRHLNRHTGELAAWGHLITNLSVDLDGDVAHVEVYVTAFFSHKDANSTTFVNGETIVSGRYIDRLDRRNGEWRIAVREFVPHFSAKTSSTVNFEERRAQATSKRAIGTWDKHDPSYLRPLTRREKGQLCEPREV